MWEEPYDSCITLTMLVLVLRPALDSGLLKAKKGFAFRPVAFLGKGPSLFLSCRRAVLGLCVLLTGPYILYEA